eukprot:XP_783506.2 PREDICTED: tRNA (adenine(58)-N(1))-methyltransferase non-catalytic subunit TRM6 [Strongylocentrotus purpuratus]
MDRQNLVAEGDNVILKKGKLLKVYKVIKKAKVFLEKRHFSLAPIVGHPYGSTWELQSGSLVQVLENTVSQDLAEQIDKGGADNRGIFDGDTTQKLDNDDIMNLREQGKSGQEIVDQLVENSSTFNERTVYSKAKYLKKKRNKYIVRFVVLRPCIRLMCEMYFNKAPSKVIQIRIDTMAQLLSAANVQSGSKVMVLENCQGLLVAAIMERLGGNGTVVHFHTEDQPMNSSLQAFNFSQKSKEMLRTFNLKDVYDNLILKKPVETINEEPSQSKDLDISQKEGGEKMSEGCDLRKEPVAMETDSSKHDTQEDVTSKNNQAASSTKPEKGSGVATTYAEDGITGTSEGLPMATDEAGEKQEEQPSEDAVDPTDKAQKRKLQFVKFLESDMDYNKRKEKKRRKLDEMAKTTEMLLENNMDTLLIATKHHPAPIVLALIDHLAWSRPFAVFSLYKEALIECYVKLRERGGVINLNITETWHREHQVLPDRTHPMTSMNHLGGYLLTGLHVAK